MFLTHEDLVELTGKERKGAQRKALTEIGIPYRIRPDGTPIVLRAAMEAAFGYAKKNEGSPSPKLRLPEARRVLPRSEGQVAKTGR